MTHSFLDQINQFKLPDLNPGPHNNPNAGMCILEMISFIESEKFGWEPNCVCHTIQTYLFSTNDMVADKPRQRLKELIPYVIGTTTDSHEVINKRRKYLRNAIDKKTEELCGEHVIHGIEFSPVGELLMLFLNGHKTHPTKRMTDDQVVDFMIKIIKEAVALDPDFEPKLQLNDTEMKNVSELETYA